jgi:hypothetical protein
MKPSKRKFQNIPETKVQNFYIVNGEKLQLWHYGKISIKFRIVSLLTFERELLAMKSLRNPQSVSLSLFDAGRVIKSLDLRLFFNFKFYCLSTVPHPDN